MSSLESIILASIGHLQSFAIVSACFCGVILWDLVYCLGSEVGYIYINEIKDCFGSKRWPSASNVLLLNSRLLTVPIVGLFIAVISPASISDEKKVVLFRAMWGLLVLATANSAAIFIVHTTAIRSSRAAMKIFLWSFGTIIVASCTYQVVTQVYSPSYFSYFLHIPTSEEIFEMNKIWRHWMITASLTVIFNMTVFILNFVTRFNDGSEDTIPNRIGNVFQEDAISYIFLTTSVSILNLIWICIHRHEGVYTAAVLPIEVWLLLTIAPRIVRKINLEDAREQYGSRANITLQLMSKSHKHTRTVHNPTPATSPPAYEQNKDQAIPFRHSVWIEDSIPVVEVSPAHDTS